MYVNAKRYCDHLVAQNPNVSSGPVANCPTSFKSRELRQQHVCHLTHTREFSWQSKELLKFKDVATIKAQGTECNLCSYYL